LQLNFNIYYPIFNLENKIMKANQFKKAVSYFALASVFTMAGCQKDDALENSTASVSNPDQASAADNGKAIEGQYIVVMNDGSTSTEVMSSEEITPSSVSNKFEGAIKGFSAKLTPDQLEALRNNPDVKSVDKIGL
jgi:hypothetical protein